MRRLQLLQTLGAELLLGWLTFAVLAEAQMTDEEALAVGIAAYDAAEFERAEAILQGLDPAQLTVEDRIRLFEYLGVLHYLAARPADAESAFYSILDLAPQHALDPSAFPPQILEAFSAARAGLVGRTLEAGLKALLDQRLEPARDLLRKVLLLAPEHAQAQELLERAERDLAQIEGEAAQQEEAARPPAVTIVAPARYQLGRAEFEAPAYIDRCYNFAQIPEEFRGMVVIRTANEDKEQRQDLVLEVEQAVEVFVGLDVRARELPDWLRAWATTSEEIVLLEERTEQGRRRGGCRKMSTIMRLRNEELGPSFTYRLYSKRFAAGQISLGPNEPREKPGRHNMYVVLVRTASAPP